LSVALTLRPARLDDAERLFAWANDPVARSASFQPEPIAWPTHLAWLERSLASDVRQLFVAERDGAPIGTARLDRDADDARLAVVSLNVAAEARGRGLGRALLDALASEARRLGYARLHAFVRTDNVASTRAFLASGYALAANVELAGAPAQRFERAL
jgi:RimJ/RimL family protein N-acetyltransferase